MGRSGPRRNARSMRRTPVQDRSRDRVDRILQAASALIAKRGSDAMRMSEVAERAGVPIGSLYQYFPDKGSVILTLAARLNAEDRACISAELAGASDPPGLAAAFARLVDVYYELYLAEPVRRDIWSGTQADKDLLAMDLEEQRACAGLVAEAMRRAGVVPRGASRELQAFLLWVSAGAAVRSALALGPHEGQQLISALKALITRELLDG